jgi:hypothetical protein
MIEKVFTDMSYTIYKPNSKSTGGLASFRVSKSEKGDDTVAQLFVEFVPQESWDSKSRTGKFSKTTKKCVMFNVSEAGEMIACLKNGYPWQTYHKSESSDTQITFGPWAKDHEVGKKGNNGYWSGKKNDWVLSVYTNGERSGITASAGEAEVLLRLLEKFVDTALLCNAANHKRRFEESQKNKD